MYEKLRKAVEILFQFLENEPIMLTDQIRRIAGRSSFRPFKLKTASGSEFTVPTREHISFGPFGVAIGVWNEQGTTCTWLSPANITEAIDEDPLTS
jgi:hypothetical protein